MIIKSQYNLQEVLHPSVAAIGAHLQNAFGVSTDQDLLLLLLSNS